MSDHGIAPGLLLAMPQLRDPNFHHSSVLMVQHDAKASLGLVINRPGETAVAEVLAPMGINWRGADDRVWSGGPVMPQSGWLLHSPAEIEPDDATIEVVPEILLSTSPDHLRLIAQQPPRHVRFLLGYAGWGAGQLEAELAAGAWLSLQATPKLVFETEPEAMWEAALRSIGIDPASLFPAAGVH